MGERVDDIVKKEILEDIAFITDKMISIRESGKGQDRLDIKQMADFHRYSETRMFLVNTLISLEREVI